MKKLRADWSQGMVAFTRRRIFCLPAYSPKDWDIQSIILLVLYGCETWPPTLRVKHRLRICEKGRRKIFWHKRYEVTGDWSWLHSEELRDLYSSQNIVCDEIKENELGGACSTYREGRCIHTGLWYRERDHLEDLAVDGRIILNAS
jgi:hypothetical protein